MASAAADCGRKPRQMCPFLGATPHLPHRYERVLPVVVVVFFMRTRDESVKLRIMWGGTWFHLTGGSCA